MVRPVASSLMRMYQYVNNLRYFWSDEVQGQHTDEVNRTSLNVTMQLDADVRPLVFRYVSLIIR
jgi:hypothetical protein